jgi:vitamin-K-epoxide reductase (warfarin-sensitive)
MSRPLLNRLVFLLALVGMFIAIFLWKMHATPDDIPCGGGNHDCADIAKSAYSRFPVSTGPPVAMLGTLGYVVLAMLALARTAAVGVGREKLLLLGSMATSLLGTLFSLRLTLYEFQIGKWCKWCVASQSLIALIFLLTLVDWLALRRTPATTEPNS